MKKIFFHSFRGGTGKSNISANISACLARKGKKVALMDLDIQSPGVHAVFGFKGSDITHSLNDFLWQKCGITEVIHNLSSRFSLGSGEIYFIPSSIETNDIIRTLREGYDFTQLTKGFAMLEEQLSPDYLVVDTHPGLYEETLFSLSIADILFIIMRPDEQDFQGTSVTLEASQKLNVPLTYLLMNKVLMTGALEDLRKRVKDTYGYDLLSMLPHSEDLLKMGSSNVFYIQYPDHPFSKEIEMITEKILLKS